MRVLRDRGEARRETAVVNFAIGALAGLAAGVVLSRILPDSGPATMDLRERARSAVRRLRPARLQRLGFEQLELDRLEDAVLEGFLADDVLRERGVDIGAISVGIIELSGAVTSQQEVQRAVALANAIPGVRTVVNRLRIETASAAGRRKLDEDDRSATFAHQEGRVGGMGRRRQSPTTDPDRPDDSQKLREEALAAADRDQWEDEGLVGGQGDAAGSANEGQPRTGFRPDEMDNQNPGGATRQPGSRPQELRAEPRTEQGSESRFQDTELPIDEPPLRDDSI
jgi:hypothetical protein